jgi:hypothetical protein
MSKRTGARAPPMRLNVEISPLQWRHVMRDLAIADEAAAARRKRAKKAAQKDCRAEEATCKSRGIDGNDTEGTQGDDGEEAREGSQPARTCRRACISRGGTTNVHC